jgi:hypothetical protein
VVGGFTRLESGGTRFDRLPLFAHANVPGKSAMMLRANLIVRLATSSSRHLADCKVVVVVVVVVFPFIVVVFAFN